MVISLCTQSYRLHPSDLGGLLRAGVVGFIGQSLHEVVMGFAGVNPGLQRILVKTCRKETEKMERIREK
eukprot:838107-Amorphochlora_amoeboformis.AAC.1